jgi:large subunit ribosomal protein L21
MKYAVVKTGGKQYKVSEGDVIEVERLNEEKEVVFDQVLLYTADGVVKVGTPLVDGVTIKASVIDQVKGDKIRVSKYKAKVRYRRVTGHRQSLTKVKIDSILGAGEKKTAPKAEEKTEPAKPARKTAAKKE